MEIQPVIYREAALCHSDLYGGWVLILPYDGKVFAAAMAFDGEPMRVRTRTDGVAVTATRLGREHTIAVVRDDVAMANGTLSKVIPAITAVWMTNKDETKIILDWPVTRAETEASG